MTLDKPSIRGVLRSPDLRVFVGFFGLTAVFYAPILLGLRSFPPGDFTDHFLPFSLFQRAELLAGRLPLWNPYTFSGQPFLADVQAAVFYPLSNLVLLLTLPWSDSAARLYWLQVEAAIHVALAGCFMYLLAKELVRKRLAAVLAGCVFAFSGYLTGYPPLQLAVLRTAIWLPLILWLLRRAFAQPESWRWWLAASVAYAVAFLAGHPQTFLFVSYAVGGWIAFLFLVTPGPRTRLLWRVGVFIGLFLALSAAQLWPSLEFTALSVRAGVDYAFASGGFPLRDTAQMLLPGFLSDFSPLYVGLIPLGLALLGIVRSVRALTAARTHYALRTAPGDRSPSQPRLDQFAPLFFVLLGTVALLVSYGSNGFLYPVFYRWAPGWAMFRGQERAAYLVAFSLSVLAGYGAAALDSFAPRSRRLSGFVYAVAAAAGVFGIGFAMRSAGDLIVSDARLLERVAAGACFLAVGAFILWRGMPERRRLWLLIAVSVVDLFVADFGVNLAPRRTGVPPAAVAMQAAMQASGPSDGSVPGRVHNEGVLFEDYGMFVGIEDVSGSSPLRLARYAALLADFPRDRLWRLAGVRQVLSSEPELYVPTAGRIEIPSAKGTAYLYQLAAANPRAWVVHSVRVLEDVNALPLLGDSSFDPETMALLAPPAVLGLEDGSLAPVGANVVRLERVASGRLVAHVRSDHGGLLVVSENWMPGWRARAQQAGDPIPHDVPVLRANLTFLGVPVRAGESTIELVYWPDSVRYGMGISGAVLLVLAGVGGYRISAGRRRKARDRGQVSAIGGLRLTQRVWRLLATRLMMPSILLVALALRAFRLGYQELRGDEALGRLFSLEPFGRIIRLTIALREPHPVASYFLQKVWLGLAGHTEFALRFTSLFFGVLAVALLYRLGRRLGLGLSASALGAALLASSPYAIWHSQDARMYSMSLALTTASTLLMLEGLARRRLRYWAAYAGVTWLALHTHYYAAYIVIAQNLFVIGRAIWVRGERRSVLPWLLVQAATGILYLPWLLVARATLTSYTGNGDSPGFLAMWLRSLSVFAGGESVPDAQRALLAFLAAVLLAIGAVRLALAGPSRRRALWLLGLYFCVPLLATWLGALSRPIFNERYLVAALPGFFLLLAAAVFEPGRDEREAKATTDFGAVLRAAAVALLAVLVGASALSLARYYTDPAYSKTHGWRLSAALLERYSSGWPAEKVRVVQTYPEPTLWYYYHGSADQLVLPPAARDAPGAAREVANLVRQGVERVVVVVQRTEVWDDRDIAPQALAKEYTLLSETPVGGWWVQVYGRQPASLSDIDVPFAGSVRLTGASIPARWLVAGDVLPIYLRWDGPPAALSGSEKITLQLLDASGKLVTQTDHPFGQAALSSAATCDIITLPRELAPGTYRLIAALYDPSKPNAPRRLTVAGSDHVELALLSTQ